jgi:hypothetical protein
VTEPATVDDTLDQRWCAATMSSTAVTAEKSAAMWLRMTATAIPESMSAYAAEPLEPTIPKVEPGRVVIGRLATLGEHVRDR